MASYVVLDNATSGCQIQNPVTWTHVGDVIIIRRIYASQHDILQLLGDKI